MNNWFTSTFQTVREKSVGALEFVRKDLSEFTTTVKNDTENYLKKTNNQQPVDDFGINRSGRNVTTENIVASSSSFDRLHHERIRLQNDESTYLIDPTPIEAYENWRETSEFNVEKHKGEIAQLLIDAPHVRSFYARLVPACTSHNDFWSRYYFRLYQLDEEETRRVNLLKRAHEICNEHSGNDWDEPDDETTTSENKENDTGDSKERELDATDLTTVKTNEIPAIQEPETVPSESTTARKTNNEFDDEWEKWS